MDKKVIVFIKEDAKRLRAAIKCKQTEIALGSDGMNALKAQSKYADFLLKVIERHENGKD